LAEDQQGQAALMDTVSRPFPTIQVRLGNVLLAIPKDWVESKFVSIHQGRTPFVYFANAYQRKAPRTTHFEVPPLISFRVNEPAAGLPERNLRSWTAEWERRWPERVADDDGFWNWKPTPYGPEYLLVEPRHPRPLDQPLIVKCSGSLRPNNKGEHDCEVSFYWTLQTGVRHDFYDTVIPKSQWVELDQRVLELLKFLDGRQAWPPQNQTGR